MLKYLLPLFLVTVVSARRARDGEAPYHVSIGSDIGHMCSGAIFDKEWILSSAKCLMGVRRQKAQYVVVGTHDVRGISGIRFPIESIHIHMNYHNNKYDIALVKINGTMKYSNKIQPVRLPERSTKPGASLRISGWKGRTDSNQTNSLLIINATAITAKACRKQIGPHLESYQICTVDNDPYGKGENFFDDRGAPIMEGDRLAAIVSIPLRKNKAGVHTRIYEFLTWVAVTTNPDNLDPEH